MMLGPFHIHNLRRLPALYPGQPGTPFATRPSNLDNAVFCVNGEAYEEAILRVPGTTLKYIDSDKDVVTVGSKEELAERLAEPVCKSNQNHSRSRQNNLSVPLRPVSADMHVFEIDHLEAAVQFWRTMEVHNTRLGLHPTRHQPVEPSPSQSHTSAEGSALYHSLEDRHTMYFENCQPPQLDTSSSPQVPKQLGMIPPANVTEPSSDRLHENPSNVLTTEGMKQAQQAGEMLRARLNHAAPYPQRNRVNRASAVNSWATYSKVVAPMQGWKSSTAKSREASEDVAAVHAAALSEKSDHSASESTIQSADSAGKISSESPERSPPQAKPSNTSRASAQMPSILRPAFFENIQASLDKLSPELNSSQMTTKSERARGKLRVESTDMLVEDRGGDVSENAGFESPEALEITLAKMVFGTIRDMSKVLESMNDQFDTLLIPKLVAERLKSKEKLLPVHRQDTVRDMFALRRSIEAFALEVAETKQTLARLDHANMFPAGTNLMDFNSMTAAAYSFGRLIRSMDDMIITARRGMLAAQLADGEPKYQTPRRLARVGYEDVWSINIVPIPTHYSITNVHNLVDEIRSEYSLGPLDVRQIVFREGLERTVEIEIEGKARAVETWSCLLHAPKRSIRLPLAERQITLTRKHYPDVLRCPALKEPVEDQASASTLPVLSRNDIDGARLKALQDRRAAWRREFKARTQSVRFEEPLVSKKAYEEPPKNTVADISPKGPLDMLLLPESLIDSSTTTKAINIPARTSQDEKLAPQRREHWDVSVSAGHRQSIRRAQSLTSGSRIAGSCARSELPQPLTDPTTNFHRLKYAPGPFAPPPPQRAVSLRSTLPVNSTLPYDPTKEAETTSCPKGDSELVSELLWRGHSAPLPFVPVLPPLPPLEPLKPERRYSTKPNLREEAALPASVALPGSWPDTEPLNNESSGAFARRMMGRSPDPSHDISPLSSPTIGATLPAEDTQQPVSPISLSARNADPAVIYESTYPQRGLRHFNSALHLGCSQQKRPEKSAGGPWSRRPYSMTFDGAGRAAVDLNTTGRTLPRNDTIPHYTMPLPRPQSTQAPVIPPSPPAAPSATAPAPLVDLSEVPEHGIKVQECVDQLKQLGYGDVHNGGIGRLVMYAQITNGDLDATIDMIEEEREAWQAQGVSTVGGDVVQDGVRDI